eukprot:TRINITY_DN1028_c0_g1_i3.p2 TRINITY_DN1028_c0_g1~~TRINITY_DN1028_c0_g1_i3.p2  ORF type:complete len:102 (+),score=1.42 TRINITY_DN1028_c0_g1_i3:386-691(+)
MAPAPEALQLPATLLGVWARADRDPPVDPHVADKLRTHVVHNMHTLNEAGSRNDIVRLESIRHLIDKLDVRRTGQRMNRLVRIHVFVDLAVLSALGPVGSR